MKLYLSASPRRRSWMKKLARELEQAGHQVTSRWIEGRYVGASFDENAMYNMADIIVADCVVVFTGAGRCRRTERVAKRSCRTRRPRTKRQREQLARELYAENLTAGSQDVELGYALRTGKRIVLVGPRENLFHHLPAIEHFRSMKELLDGLA